MGSDESWKADDVVTTGWESPRIAGCVAEVIGATGSPILLLPGGAATSRDFFPSLQRLVGHRIVLVDRPGTGRAVDEGPATLTSGSEACAAVLRQTGCAPALVVGQSLGGALAVQLAVDHPDLVSGLVLIDPTPFNDARVCRQARLLFEALTLPTRIPRIGPRVDRALWRALETGVHAEDDEARIALRALGSASLGATARAIRSIVGEGAALTARLAPLTGPCVIVTADRKDRHRVRRAHAELTRRLGGRMEEWPGAVHAEHIRSPARLAALVEDVAAGAEQAIRIPQG